MSGFFPLWVGTERIVFLDTLANVDLPDLGNVSSLTHSQVVGATVSTSTRLGYRWLNGDRTWMFGVTGGYDSRPLTTGQPASGVSVSNTQTLFFQQIAAGLEAYSATWDLKAYALLPTGQTRGVLNSAYDAGALTTYGLDVGYAITPNLHASVGYYYQNSDLKNANGSGGMLNLSYGLSDSLSVGVTLSYDDVFETRLSGNIKYRLGSFTTRRKSASLTRPLQALTESPAYRVVRIHDECAVRWCSKEEDKPAASQESKTEDAADPASPSKTPLQAKDSDAAPVAEPISPAATSKPVATQVQSKLRGVVRRSSASTSTSPSGQAVRSTQLSEPPELRTSTDPREPSSRIESGVGTRLGDTRAFLRSAEPETIPDTSEVSGVSRSNTLRSSSFSLEESGFIRSMDSGEFRPSADTGRPSEGPSISRSSDTDSSSSPSRDSESSSRSSDSDSSSTSSKSSDSSSRSSDSDSSSTSSKSSDSSSRSSDSDSSSSPSRDSDSSSRSSSSDSSSRSSRDSDSSSRSSSSDSSSRSSRDSDSSSRSSSSDSSSRSSRDSDSSSRSSSSDSSSRSSRDSDSSSRSSSSDSSSRSSRDSDSSRSSSSSDSSSRSSRDSDSSRSSSSSDSSSRSSRDSDSSSRSSSSDSSSRSSRDSDSSRSSSSSDSSSRSSRDSDSSRSSDRDRRSR